jgi:hypothetical protein
MPDRPDGFTDFLHIGSHFTIQFRNAKEQPSYAPSTPRRTFPFSIPGVLSSHDQSHCEWNLVPFSVPL